MFFCVRMWERKLRKEQGERLAGAHSFYGASKSMTGVKGAMIVCWRARRETEMWEWNKIEASESWELRLLGVSCGWSPRPTCKRAHLVGRPAQTAKQQSKKGNGSLHRWKTRNGMAASQQLEISREKQGIKFHEDEKNVVWYSFYLMRLCGPYGLVYHK